MLTGGPAPEWAPVEGDVILVDGEEVECFYCDGWREDGKPSSSAADAARARFFGAPWDEEDPYTPGVSCFYLEKGDFSVVGKAADRKRPEKPTIYKVTTEWVKSDDVFDPEWHVKPLDAHGNLAPAWNSVTRESLRLLYVKAPGIKKRWSHYGGTNEFTFETEAQASFFADEALKIKNVASVVVTALRPLWEKRQ